MSEPIAIQGPLHAPLTSRVGMAGFTVGIVIVAIIFHDNHLTESAIIIHGRFLLSLYFIRWCYGTLFFA